MKGNILSDNAIHPCTGCGICASVCPTEAITMAFDNEGFYRPILNVEKCIDCSACIKSCYKYNHISEYNIERHPEVRLYACKAKDKSILQSTSSGGIAYLLAKTLYKEGYRCYGVVYDLTKDYATHICAEKEEDIDLFKGSKYIQSVTFPAFKEMIAKNKVAEKTALFGTPCQIYAVSQYLDRVKKRDNFILIDIYCHGCPSVKLWQAYIRQLKEIIGNSSYNQVFFRSKRKGWGNFVVTLELEDSPVFVSKRTNNQFYQLFFSKLMLNDACIDCSLRGSLAFTDIRLGDFWGKCYDCDETGVSGVTLVTKKGSEIFNRIRSEITVKEHSFSDFLPYQTWKTRYKIDFTLRSKLFDMLDNGVSLKKLVSCYYSHQPISQKLKRYLKNVVLLLPMPLVNRIKMIYHK